MLIFTCYLCVFLAVSINYAQAFRVKNKLISIVEQYEGWSRGSDADNAIIKYLGDVKYTGEYKVERRTTARGPYYKITTYISFEFPIVGTFFTFPVTGETRVMYNKL